MPESEFDPFEKGGTFGRPQKTAVSGTTGGDPVSLETFSTISWESEDLKASMTSCTTEKVNTSHPSNIKIKEDVLGLEQQNVDLNGLGVFDYSADSAFLSQIFGTWPQGVQFDGEYMYHHYDSMEYPPMDDCLFT